jgi:hypothetical protein
VTARRNYYPPETNFAIAPSDFIKSYEQLKHNPQFTVFFEKFETSMITMLLEKILT